MVSTEWCISSRRGLETGLTGKPRLLRKDERYAGLPMVMLTTEGQADTIRAGKHAGASGWIVKPFNDLQLEMTVRKFIGKPN